MTDCPFSAFFVHVNQR